MKEIQDRAMAAYLGLAIGDALGATTEFMRPTEIKNQIGIHRNIVGGGWLRLKPGKVTDDTEMALALGDALLEAKGMDPHCVGEHFVKWMASKPVDIGNTVRRGIRDFKLKGQIVAHHTEYAAGNGAAMRMLPVIIATLGNTELMREWLLHQGHVTHNHEKSDVGCFILGEIAMATILGGQTAPLHTIANNFSKEYPEFDYRKYKGETEGYIIYTVLIVLHFFFYTNDFESCLIGIVNRGGDADTNGAIVGMLAGAFYGLESIPSRWLRKLDPAVKKQVEQQVNDLFEVFPFENP